MDGLEVQTVEQCQGRIVGSWFILQGREKEMNFVLVVKVWGGNVYEYEPFLIGKDAIHSIFIYSLWMSEWVGTWGRIAVSFVHWYSFPPHRVVSPKNEMLLLFIPHPPSAKLENFGQALVVEAFFVTYNPTYCVPP